MAPRLVHVTRYEMSAGLDVDFIRYRSADLSPSTHCAIVPCMHGVITCASGHDHAMHMHTGSGLIVGLRRVWQESAHHIICKHDSALVSYNTTLFSTTLRRPQQERPIKKTQPLGECRHLRTSR